MYGPPFQQSSPEFFLGEPECHRPISANNPRPGKKKISIPIGQHAHTTRIIRLPGERKMQNFPPLTKGVCFCVLYNNRRPARTAPTAFCETKGSPVQGPKLCEPEYGVRDASTPCTRSRRPSARSGHGVVEYDRCKRPSARSGTCLRYIRARGRWRPMSALARGTARRGSSRCLRCRARSLIRRRMECGD